MSGSEECFAQAFTNMQGIKRFGLALISQLVSEAEC